MIKTESEHSGAPSSQAAIMVVDDNPANVDLLTKMLTDNGYKVKPSTSGRFAMQSAQINPPDLILLDIKMPDMDGLSVCKALKKNKNTSEVPIIFISALQEIDDKIEAFEAGGVDYIAKPFQEAEVLARVKTHISLYKMQQHLENIVHHRTAELTRKTEKLQQEIIERKRTEEQLAHAQKMEGVGLLAGGIAHDFNNILSAIMGYGDLALISTSPESRIYSMLQQILKAADRARDLVLQILTLTRKTKYQAEPLAIQLIFKEVVKLLQATIPSTVKITQNISKNCGLVLADSTQIHQIIMNLATNAYHSMREQNGELELSLEPVEIDNTFMVTTTELSKGSYVMLTVKDTGCGMDKKTLDKIFEPYFTTKPQGEGTGLGLAVIQGIIANLKGGILVKSQVGKGTIFYVYIPMINSAKKLKNKEVPLPIPRGNEHILLVDDEETIVRVMAEMLSGLGYKISAFSKSSEALAAFSKNPDLFELVITDQTMPGITGVDLAQQMLKIKNNALIILCSGFSKQVDMENAGKMGFSKFLAKPIAIKELGVAVRDVLDHKKK